MSVFGVGAPSALPASILQLNRELQDLQTQLGTGRKATTFGGLGADRTLALDLRGEIASIEGYRKTVQTVSLRATVAGQALERMDGLLSETQSSLALTAYDIGIGNQTVAQYGAKEKTQEIVALLNSEVSGAFLFSGRDTDKEPVAAANAILEGDGAKAGLRTIVEQRLAADSGADGLGRLSPPAAVAGVVTLSEDAAGHPFGLKLATVSEALTGTTAAGPTGTPAAVTVTFTSTLPVDGEQITLGFDLPDGSSETVTLTATATAPPEAGQFLIGADETATAANFQSSLTTAVEGLVATAGSAASLVAAGTDFFDFDPANPPQRVDGPPYETATALIDATTTDTVFWYQGEASITGARASVTARIDTGYTIEYGLRANEEALREGLKFTSLLSTITFVGDPQVEKDRYAEVKERLTPGLLTSNGQANVRQIATEVALKTQVLDATLKRHNTAVSLAQTTLDDTEGVDLNEVGARILALQTHLQASYQSTAILSRLTLLEYI